MTISTKVKLIKMINLKRFFAGLLASFGFLIINEETKKFDPVKNKAIANII